MQNREIKFRAWDGNPSFGYKKRMYYDIIVGRGVVICTVDEEEFSDGNLEGNYMTMDNSKAGFIIMQYTGLSDKKGSEIYEGDLLELVNDLGDKIIVECVFGNAERRLLNIAGEAHACQITGFYFCVNRQWPSYPIVKNYLGKHDLEIMEVVGNIYENPELIDAPNDERSVATDAK